MNMDMRIRFHEKKGFLTRRTSEEKKEEAEAIKIGIRNIVKMSLFMDLWYFGRSYWYY